MDPTQTFTYRGARSPALTTAVIGAVAVEPTVLHLALHGRHPALAWALTGLSLLTLGWLAADARAFARGALRLGPDALHVAVGRRWAGAVPRGAVERVLLRPTWRDLPGPGAARAGYANLTAPATPNVLVVLHGPVPLRAMGGPTRPVTRVGLRLDAPEAFVGAPGWEHPGRGRPVASPRLTGWRPGGRSRPATPPMQTRTTPPRPDASPGVARDTARGVRHTARRPARADAVLIPAPPVRTRSATHEDYVLRLIRQAADALRRFRLRLAGDDGAPAAVRHDAAAAVRALLGDDASLLERLDAPSAARLVGDPQRVALWHGLLDVEAAAAEAEGDLGAAAVGRARAAALRAAAAAAWPDQAPPA